MKKIKVIIVDDSTLIQKMLSSILNSDPDISVVGLADNPLIARQIIKILNPDVLVLDIDMPEMDGLTFLEKIMSLRPMPVVMCSSFTPHCQEVTLETFRLGVIDIIGKPISGKDAPSIIAKIKNAANAKVKKLEKTEFDSKPMLLDLNAQSIDQDHIFAIGASTGGTEALKSMFQVLPENFPPILVTQHIPEGFGAMFAERVNMTSKMEVAIARDGDKVEKGHAYIAPAGKHMELEKKGKEFYIKLEKNDGKDKQAGHVPSVDIMMRSIAKVSGKHATAIILTGMGEDGAQGMLDIKNAGGKTIAQDEKSSVVWGMPRAAVELGAVQHVLPLEQIPAMMVKSMRLSQ